MYQTLTEFLSQFSAPVQALFATLFTWGMTALGATLVFFFREVKRRTMDIMLGFAGGVMLAARFLFAALPGSGNVAPVQRLRMASPAVDSWGAPCSSMRSTGSPRTCTPT